MSCYTLSLLDIASTCPGKASASLASSAARYLKPVGLLVCMRVVMARGTVSRVELMMRQVPNHVSVFCGCSRSLVDAPGNTCEY